LEGAHGDEHTVENANHDQTDWATTAGFGKQRPQKQKLQLPAKSDGSQHWGRQVHQQQVLQAGEQQQQPN
jgi:hypothetical protein